MTYMAHHGRTIVVSILCACFVFVANAQQKVDGSTDVNYLRAVTPPSPTVAGLGRFADFPVSLYTGVPEISIPLYELHTRSVPVPISLSYHASGIRVAEIASWTGLGWSLNAGGVISRSMRGLPDEMTSGYLEIRESYSDPINLSSTFLPDTTQYINHLINVAHGNRDTEPDQFSINALGKSYKLLQTARRDSMITQPFSRIKVILTESPGAIESWTVTLEDGTILIFGTGESYYERMIHPRLGDVIGDIGSYISAWHLKQVRTIQNEIVNFTYTDETVKQSAVFSETDMDRHEYEPGSSGPGGGRYYFYEPEVKTCRLTSIQADLETIEFEVASRLDLGGGNALRSIKVKSISGDERRRFNLYYDYSQAVSSHTFGGNDTFNKRLKLMSIEETTDLDVGKVWDLQYNPNSLPSRSSFAQDHFGYFNNAVSNKTLLPFDLRFDPLNKEFANRQLNDTAVFAEMLNKITYPTGGYTEFNFEPNSVKDLLKFYRDTTVHCTQSSGSITLQLDKPQIINFNFNATFSAADFPGIFKMALATLTRSGQSAGLLVISRSQLGPSLPPGNHYTTEIGTRLALQAGTYTLSVQDNSEHLVSMEATIQYDVLTDERIGDKLVGGVRIKSIYDYDANDSRLKKRFFVYEDPFLISEVSDADYITELPIKVYTCASSNVGEGGSFSEQRYTWWARYSTLRYSQGDVQGGTVGYGKVTTLDDEQGLNGKTVSYFSNSGDWNVADSKVPPFVPVISIPWRRGSLLKEEQYAAGDTLIRVTNNNYEFVEKSRVKAYRASFRYTGVGCQWFDNINDFIVRVPYDIINEQVNLKSTEQLSLIHSSTTVDTIRTVTNYFYDTQNNPQWSRMETRDSQDKVLKIVKYGPLEKLKFQSALGVEDKEAIDAMIERNILTLPWVSFRYRDNKLIDSVVTQYKKWPSDIIAPKAISVKNGKKIFETRAVFTKYDAYGNLLEQSKINDASTSYIYDYSSTYPVAQVINANVESVAYTSFEANGSGGWTKSGSNVNDDTAPTGKKVYNLGSGSINKSELNASDSYRISFWYKGAQPTVTGTLSGVTTISHINGWYFYQARVTGATTVLLTGTALIDELRLYPLHALMSTYTYDPLIGMTSMTDLNGKSTHYLYDNFGRLYLIKDKDGNIVNRYRYHYRTR